MLFCVCSRQTGQNPVFGVTSGLPVIQPRSQSQANAVGELTDVDRAESGALIACEYETISCRASGKTPRSCPRKAGERLTSL